MVMHSKNRRYYFLFLIVLSLFCLSNTYASSLSEGTSEKNTESCENNITQDTEGLCQSVFVYDENNNFVGVECPDPVSPCADHADFKNLWKNCSKGKNNTRCESFGIYTCDETTGEVYCNAKDLPVETEICDGIDNDCDGIVDNITDYGKECTGDTVGYGVCSNNKGTYQCLNNTKTCVVKTNDENATAETCDNIGVDNDCDGDENDDPAGCGLISCNDLSLDDVMPTAISNTHGDLNKTTYKKEGDYAYQYGKVDEKGYAAVLCMKNPNAEYSNNLYYSVEGTLQGVYKNKTKNGETYTRDQLKSFITSGSGDVGNYDKVTNNGDETKKNRQNLAKKLNEEYKSTEKIKQGCFICVKGRDTGCFSPETLIALADGSQKQAKEIAVGDKLFNPITRSAVTVKRVIEGPEAIGLVSIKFNGGELKVSQDHPMLTANGLKPAKDLKAGDTIFNGDNAEVTVSSAEILPVEEGQWVVNFLLEGADMSKSENRMLLSDGIISGDLQTQLELTTVQE